MDFTWYPKQNIHGTHFHSSINPIGIWSVYTRLNIQIGDGGDMCCLVSTHKQTVLYMCVCVGVYDQHIYTSICTCIFTPMSFLLIVYILNTFVYSCGKNFFGMHSHNSSSSGLFLSLLRLVLFLFFSKIYCRFIAWRFDATI